MIIEGNLTLKASCGHEITTDFGTVEVAGISRIAGRILRDECPACKFAARRYRLTRVSIDGDNTAALEALHSRQRALERVAPFRVAPMPLVRGE